MITNKYETYLGKDFSKMFLTVLNICTEMSTDWKLMHMKEWAPL